MTSEEKQEIINAVLAALRTNSKTIDQLTPVSEMSDEDFLELNGGRKVSYGTVKSLLGAIFDESIDDKLDVNNELYIDESGRLRSSKSTCVVLKSMGSTLDNAFNDSQNQWSYIASVGDTYYDATTKKIVYYEAVGSLISSDPDGGLVYCNAHTGATYCWKVTDWEQVGGMGNDISVINDLTTGGEEDALSAEQGKVLKDLVDESFGAVSHSQSSSEFINSLTQLGISLQSGIRYGDALGMVSADVKKATVSALIDLDASNPLLPRTFKINTPSAYKVSVVSADSLGSTGSINGGYVGYSIGATGSCTDQSEVATYPSQVKTGKPASSTLYSITEKNVKFILPELPSGQYWSFNVVEYTVSGNTVTFVKRGNYTTVNAAPWTLDWVLDNATNAICLLVVVKQGSGASSDENLTDESEYLPTSISYYSSAETEGTWLDGGEDNEVEIESDQYLALNFKAADGSDLAASDLTALAGTVIKTESTIGDVGEDESIRIVNASGTALRKLYSGKTSGLVQVYDKPSVDAMVSALASAIEEATTAIGTAKKQLRVCSWNIGHFSLGTQETTTILDAEAMAVQEKRWKNRLDSLGANIMLTSEHSVMFATVGGTNYTAREKVFSRWPYAAECDKDNRINNVSMHSYIGYGIFTDLVLDNVETIKFSFGTRGFMVADATLGCWTFKLAVVHNDFDGTNNDSTQDVPYRQVQEIITALANEPRVILAGDWNQESDKYFKPLRDAGYTLASHAAADKGIKTYPATGIVTGKSSPYTLNANQKTAIDDIAVKGFDISNVQIIDDGLLTDHCAIMCDLVANWNNETSNTNPNA